MGKKAIGSTAKSIIHGRMRPCAGLGLGPSLNAVNDSQLLPFFCVIDLIRQVAPHSGRKYTRLQKCRFPARALVFPLTYTNTEGTHNGGPCGPETHLHKHSSPLRRCPSSHAVWQRRGVKRSLFISFNASLLPSLNGHRFRTFVELLV